MEQRDQLSGGTGWQPGQITTVAVPLGPCANNLGSHPARLGALGLANRAPSLTSISTHSCLSNPPSHYRHHPTATLPLPRTAQIRRGAVPEDRGADRAAHGAVPRRAGGGAAAAGAGGGGAAHRHHAGGGRRATVGGSQGAGLPALGRTGLRREQTCARMSSSLHAPPLV